jgi:hypothetical protein
VPPLSHCNLLLLLPRPLLLLLLLLVCRLLMCPHCSTAHLLLLSLLLMFPCYSTAAGWCSWVLPAPTFINMCWPGAAAGAGGLLGGSGQGGGVSKGDACVVAVPCLAVGWLAPGAAQLLHLAVPPFAKAAGRLVRLAGSAMCSRRVQQQRQRQQQQQGQAPHWAGAHVSCPAQRHSERGL